MLWGLPWKPSATSLSSDWFYATGHHRVTGERPEESSRGAEIGKFVTGYVLWLPAVRQPPDVDLSIDAVIQANQRTTALYSVTCPRLSKIGSNVAKCVVCLQTMDEWDSTEIRVYKLIQRPEDA